MSYEKDLQELETKVNNARRRVRDQEEMILAYKQRAKPIKSPIALLENVLTQYLNELHAYEAALNKARAAQEKATLKKMVKAAQEAALKEVRAAQKKPLYRGRAVREARARAAREAKARVSQEATEAKPEANRNNRHIPKKVQREVWRRDQGRCTSCGSNELLEYDHIIPVTKGGSNTDRNVQLLCETCNRTKGANI